MLAFTILWDWFDGTRHVDQNTFLYAGLLSFLNKILYKYSLHLGITITERKSICII